MKIIFLVLSLLFLSNTYAQICTEGTYLVKGHSRTAYYRNDGTHVAATSVNTYCRHYRDDGPLKQQFLIKMPKGWPHQKEDFKRCSKAKQKKISKILSSIPKFLTSIGKLKIYCSKKSNVPNNPATSSPETKIIVLYDSSFKMNTRRIIIHELAHLLWTRLSAKEIKSYLNTSRWVEPIKGFFIYNRTSFSAPDGKQNPEEDFANNIEYYFSEPKKFKSRFPKISLWIKNFSRGNK